MYIPIHAQVELRRQCGHTHLHPCHLHTYPQTLTHKCTVICFLCAHTHSCTCMYVRSQTQPAFACCIEFTLLFRVQVQCSGPCRHGVGRAYYYFPQDSPGLYPKHTFACIFVALLLCHISIFCGMVTYLWYGCIATLSNCFTNLITKTFICRLLAACFQCPKRTSVFTRPCAREPTHSADAIRVCKYIP